MWQINLYDYRSSLKISAGIKECGCELKNQEVSTKKSLQQTHASTHPAPPTHTPTQKPKQKKCKRKRRRGHGWSKRRKRTSSRSCAVVTTKTPTPTPAPTPKPKPDTKTNHECNKSRKPTPSNICEVETRYEFFRQSFPINSSRPATMKSIRLSESLGSPIFEMLMEMTNNGDFDHPTGPSTCSCHECPYSTGDHRDQICLLMQRLHEILCDN